MRASGGRHPVAYATIRDAVMAVQEESVPWALVPIENSIEGSVTVTLDTLVAEAGDVYIVGEFVLGGTPLPDSPRAGRAGADRRPSSPIPTFPASARVFCTSRLPRAQISAASSTAEAVRRVADDRSGQMAAIGTQLAARLYGCAVIAEDIQDRADNETRFVWLARSRRGPVRLCAPGGAPGQDLARFLGRRRRPAGLARALPRRVRPRASQPHEDRVAADARAPRPVHVLSRPRGIVTEQPGGGGAGGSARAAANRCACSAPTRQRERDVPATGGDCRGIAPSGDRTGARSRPYRYTPARKMESKAPTEPVGSVPPASTGGTDRAHRRVRRWVAGCSSSTPPTSRSTSARSGARWCCCSRRRRR